MGLQSIVASEKLTGNFIVWDFGGNNMQFSIINNGKTSAVIGLPGSNSIRTEVMNKLKKKKTPNPIGLKNVYILEKHLLAKLTSNLDTLKQYKDFEVYGIGGVHTKSIYSGMLHILNDAEAKKMYSQEQVMRLLNELVKMNDSLIGGKFPEDQASNVIAVNTIMNHVGWKSVKVSEQTLALGYLISK
jgi:exopolyphosphatase/pppGpp-phosphohydrolase